MKKILFTLLVLVFNLSMGQYETMLLASRQQAQTNQIIYSDPIVSSQKISTGLNDLEESMDGTVVTAANTSSDLEFAYDGGFFQRVGLRFESLGIPKDALIENVYVQFTTDEPSAVASPTINIVGELASNSSPFVFEANNLLNRTKTVSSVTWSNIPQWATVPQSGLNQRSPELKTIVQEIVNQVGYSSTSAISLFFENTGNETATRIAESFDGGTGDQPEIFVTYKVPIIVDVTNLIAYYDFEDNGNDVLGNHNGTVTNALYSTDAIVGLKSLQMDGDADYLEIPDSNDFSFGNGTVDSPFSVSAWVNFNDTGDHIISSKRGSGGNEWQFNYFAGDLLLILYSTGGDIRRDFTWTPTINTWYHVACSYDGSGTSSGIKLYLDGVEQTATDNNTGTYTAMSNTTANLYAGVFGPLPSNQVAFDGEMDLLQFWSEELTETKVANIRAIENSGDLITENALTPTDIIADLNPDLYLKPEDITATTWADASGNGLDGSVVGTMTVGTAGGYNELITNGSSYVDIPVDPLLVKTLNTDSFSIVILEGPNNFWTTGYPISKASLTAGDREYGWWYNGSICSTYIGGVTTNLTDPPLISNRLWIATFNAGSWEIFCDGVSMGTGTTASSSTTTQSVNLFGRSDGGYLANNGASLSMAAIIPSALTAQQRADIEAQWQVN